MAELLPGLSWTCYFFIYFFLKATLGGEKKQVEIKMCWLLFFRGLFCPLIVCSHFVVITLSCCTCFSFFFFSFFALGLKRGNRPSSPWGEDRHISPLGYKNNWETSFLLMAASLVTTSTQPENAEESFVNQHFLVTPRLKEIFLFVEL